MGKKKSLNTAQPSKKLDILADDDDDDGGLTINKGYAERYETWRRLEEMQKMKDRYGNKAADEVEESDSEESDDAAEWTAEDEKNFLTTLSALKGGDERLYNKDEKFFHEKDLTKTGVAKDNKTKKEKPMFLRDYERKLVTEKGGDIDESGDEEREEDPSYHALQTRNKEALKKAIDGDDDDDDLLMKREKTEDEKKRDEDEYYEWIAGDANKVIGEKEKRELKSLKKAWTSTSMADDEKFLRDYILNKQYDVDNDEAHIPSYDEIVGTTLEEDDEMERKGREYERKYNFRFEEPDQEFVKSYPRSIAESVRQTKESKRTEKRNELLERKAREKEEKKADIKQLKKMKKAEIEGKLGRLKKITGEDIPLRMEDLDGDFDPKEYDRRMQELFNGSYYEVEDEGEGEETEKPVFSDLSDDDFESASDYDEMPIGSGRAVKEEDDQEEEKMEEKKPKKAFEAAAESLRKEKDASRRRRKRNTVFVDAVNREKPLFDPKDKTFEEYFNEYYALDYEDIIGDTRTRFHYRSVPANSFGLTTDEILSADDRQLNAWASIKKAVAYRTENEEKCEIKNYMKKGEDIEKKKKIFSIDFGGKRSKKIKEAEEQDRKEQNGEEPSAISNGATENGEKKKKKKKKNKKSEGATESNVQTQVVETPPMEQSSKEKKGRSRKRNRAEDVDAGMADERLAAYGINPKKYKQKIFYGKKKDQ